MSIKNSLSKKSPTTGDRLRAQHWWHARQVTSFQVTALRSVFSHYASHCSVRVLPVGKLRFATFLVTTLRFVRVLPVGKRVLPFGKRVLPSASVSCPRASLVTSFVSCLLATFARGDFSTQEMRSISVQKIFDFLALFFPL